MGAIRWGTRGTRPPTFSDSGDIICHDPTFFSLGFVIYWFHTRTVARKFSIGGICISAGDLWVCAGDLTQKIGKTQLIYGVSCFNLGGLGALFVGAQPSGGDGTVSHQAAPSHFTTKLRS